MQLMLQNFPDELFRAILVQAIIARGVKRGLRLRLVCQLFASKIIPALFESRLLDDFHAGSIVDCHIQNNSAASALWHSYLVYRVQNEKSTGQIRFLNIRRLSKVIVEEDATQLDVTSTIEALCRPALREVMWHSHANVQMWIFSDNKPSCLGQDLLSAAAYLNAIPFAKRLLEKGYRPTNKGHIFHLSPMGLAAWAGNAEMMQLFQEITPTNDENGLRDSLMGIAIRGDVLLAGFVIYHPSSTTPDSMNVFGQQFGKLKRNVGAGAVINDAQRSTRSVELYQYLEQFFVEPDERDWALVRNAKRGNLEMVRHLLDAGADIRGTQGTWGNPLCCAVRSYREDIVTLLLERGADPNFWGDGERCQGRNSIWTAAQASSLALVRKLIAHGGYLSLPRFGRLIMKAAVLTENTDIVNLLLDLGVDPGMWNEELARSQGLDSMKEMIQKATCSEKEGVGDEKL